MAHKVKRTLTWAEWEKIRKDNARRAKEMKVKREKGKISSKVEVQKEEGA